MSIKIDHVTQEFGVTDQTKPLTIDAPGGLLLRSTAPESTEGIIAYDYTDHVMKYRTDSKWVVLGSSDDFSNKARKLNSTDFGGAGATSKTYLTVENSQAVWRDPATDGFIRFGNEPVTLQTRLTFTSPVTFTKDIDCSSQAVRNIVAGDANDAVPKSYVDGKIHGSTSDLVNSLNAAYSDLLKKYQTLIAAIYNEPFPAKPEVPVVVPPIVVPPEPVIPPEPAKTFNMNYTVRILSPNESPIVLASWAAEQATIQNNNINPGVGSTFYVTFKQKTGRGVPKVGTVFYNVSKYATFSWTGTTAGLVNTGEL